ncbi:MAG TPA: tRNA (adenosine(37)-N6)-threonylcarbamoyltransferase complex ATPase subunit type 1 TsaE [Longimicrobiaceae bacterium]|nr:tRNA (adenosine(37)-N6)-threonylcarbamoyltransferase complex ATPase subunit type 1 TsaE [Longimicrobiaceae bacterium]
MGSAAELTEEELVAWGERVGAAVEVPAVFALRGDLGAGKSTLARAIARGAGVEGPVPSPTFNLLFRYETARAAVHHLDLYRLERPDDVWELGWAELGGGPELVLIEWPERADTHLPSPRWEVRLEELGDPGRRRVELAPVGEPPALPPLPADGGAP